MFISCASDCILFIVEYPSKCVFIKANQQNILELSIVDHAKHMIHHNNRIKLCHTSEKIIKDKDERIQNIDVHFEDHETFIECTYLDVSMKIYYDDKAIVSVDIDEQ